MNVLKKILLLIDKLSMDGVNPSSITLNTRDIAPHFRQCGFDISVCDIRAPEPAGACLEEAGISLDYLGKRIFSPSILPALLDVMDKHKPALLHCHGYNAANFGRLAAGIRRIPVVVHEHAILKIKPHQFLADLALRNRISAGIAVSNAVKEFMVRGRCMPRNRIRVIPNGTKIEKYARISGDRAESERRRLEIPQGHRVVGTLTRFRKEKGNRYLLDAAVSIFKECPDTVIVLAGDGPLFESLREQARRLNIEDRIRFPGFVADAPLILSLFDVAVIPSLKEGFAFAAVEAMANGCPIAASDTGGLAEIIKDGFNGLLAPVADSGALAKQIVRMLKDRELANSLAQNGLSEARKYSIENYANNVSRLYAEMLG